MSRRFDRSASSGSAIVDSAGGTGDRCFASWCSAMSTMPAATAARRTWLLFEVPKLDRNRFGFFTGACGVLGRCVC